MHRQRRKPGMGPQGLPEALYGTLPGDARGQTDDRRRCRCGCRNVPGCKAWTSPMKRYRDATVSAYFVAMASVASMACSPTASALTPLRSTDCPSAVYSAVLNAERYRQECFTLVLRRPSPEVSVRMSVSRVEEGGAFELSLANAYWTDRQNVCPSLVIRMPWSDAAEVPDAIAGKEALHAALEAFNAPAHGTPTDDADALKLAIMVTRDSLLHSSRPADTAPDDDRRCLIYFQADGETGRYLGEASHGATGRRG